MSGLSHQRSRPGPACHSRLWTRTIKLLTFLLALGALLALVWGLQPAGAVDAGAVVQSQQGASIAAAERASASGSSGNGRIAMRLAPGHKLQARADGSLQVVRTQGPTGAGAVELPVGALDRVGEIESLNIQVLEPVSSAASVVAASAAVTEVVTDEMLEALRLLPGVLWAEATRPVHACFTPNDPWYPVQSSLTQAGLPAAWDVTTGSPDVVVAVVDTGLRGDIADFAGRTVYPYRVGTGALAASSAWADWQDTHGHGTAVAAVAVAQGNDGQGMAGAAWNVKIMPVKIAGTGDSDDVTLAAGITYAVDKGADVINVSFAGAESTRALRDAVDFALSRGVVIVAAAGNHGYDYVEYPAALPGVIAVGATDRNRARWTSSNQGAALHLVAPGCDILSYKANSASASGSWTGTSFSTPLVAGVAALLKSVNPSLTPLQVADIFRRTADDLGDLGWDRTFGWGFLDAGEAVAEAAGTASTTTTSTTSTTLLPTTTTTSTTSTTFAPTTTTTLTTTPSRFADVSPETTPYVEQIERLAAGGVVQGFTTDKGLPEFRPNANVIRQQFAKMIVLALDYPVSERDTCTFIDVDRPSAGSLYPYHYVAVAYNRGITKGTNPPLYFSPTGKLSRAQMITMVVRAIGLPDPPADYRPSFPNFSSVHYSLARKAAYAGLLDPLDGMGPKYDFFRTATRGEVCALLAPLLR